MENKRLAIINTKGRFFSQRFLEEYAKAGIEYDFANNLDDFLEQHNLQDYSGVLMHPPLGEHKSWLERVQENAPNIRIAFGTINLESTLQRAEVEKGIPLLDFYYVEDIIKYFGIDKR